jgi:isochorismate synthase
MSEFVLFKLPNEPQIYFWEGNFNYNAKHFLFENSNDTFVLSEFNAGNTLVYLEPIKKRVVGLDELFNLAFEFREQSINQTNQDEYEQMVLEIQQAIHTHSNLNKVVLARATLVNQKLDLLASFYALCKAFPNAFVYLASSLVYGTWIGASPEVFLSIRGNNFETYALAGTKTNHQNWSKKEIEEQNWVTKYIEQQLCELGVAYSKTPTETIASGLLFHLKTTLLGKVQELSNYNAIIQKMNPTPAVAGIEKNEAIALIKKLEKNNRSLYSGIIGPVFENKSAQLYVNLRCLEAYANAYSLYAGAGITKDSNPRDEWFETEKKLENTKRVLI